MSKRPVFIVTKPLQFMVAATIIDELGLSAVADILVTDTFAEAAEFVYQYHGVGPRWGRIGLFPSIREAYRYARDECRYSALYIDSDTGVQKMLTLARLKMKHPSAPILVYEEGVGTYRRDIYPPVKRELIHRLGAGAAFGGSPLTSGIFVYDVDAYQSRVGRFGGTPYLIETELAEFIAANAAVLGRLFGVPDTLPSTASDTCTVYLTNWTPDEKVIREISDRPGDCFVKPHPHLSSADGALFGGVRLLPAGIPAELLIMKLRASYSRMTVLHHGSSTATYLPAHGVEYETINGA